MLSSANILKFVLPIVVTLTTVSSYAVIENCDKGVSFNNGNTYKKVTGIVNCVQRDNPRIKTRTVTLKNGKEHGKTTVYSGLYQRKNSAKNHIVAIENYNNGKKHGKFITYDEKIATKIKLEKEYKDGLEQREMRLSADGGKTVSFYKPKGKWSQKIGSLSYNKAGQLSDKSCPKAASHIPELNNVCGFGSKKQVVTLRDHKGKVKATSVMVQGKNKENKSFYASGKIRTIKSPNLAQSFYESGKLKEKVIGASGGDLTRIFYYPSGVKKSLKRSSQHIILETRDWYMNGKPKYVKLYQAKTKTATIKHYYGNGQLEEDYKAIKKGYSLITIGNYRSYFKNGKASSESSYSNTGKLQREKIYFDNGQLMRSTVVNSDGSRLVKKYTKSGTLEKSASYFSDGSIKE